MRRSIMVLFAAGAIISSPSIAAAHGYRHHHHHMTHHFGRYLSARHLHHLRHYARRHHHRVYHTARAGTARAGPPGPCRVAASMGGPCGCWAAYVLLDRLDHVWHGINLWLANDWLRFPHVAAAPGTAAVWPGRHVAPVIAVNGDRTVTVRDSWTTHKVSMAHLVFVQPPTQHQARPIAWPSGTPL